MYLISNFMIKTKDQLCLEQAYTQIHEINILDNGKRYKIQVSTTVGSEGDLGWADLKSSTDGGEYETDIFNSEFEAKQELSDILEYMNESPDNYRIVSVDVEEDINMYF